MQSFSELIDCFGGAAQMASEIDVPANTIRQWAARDSIPAWSWQGIVEAAKRRSIEAVTLELLASLAARLRPGKSAASEAATEAASAGPGEAA